MQTRKLQAQSFHFYFRRIPYVRYWKYFVRFCKIIFLWSQNSISKCFIIFFNVFQTPEQLFKILNAFVRRFLVRLYHEDGGNTLHLQGFQTSTHIELTQPGLGQKADLTCLSMVTHPGTVHALLQWSVGNSRVSKEFETIRRPSYRCALFLDNGKSF